ncbi:hypothetical protein [Methylocapsa aurea]|uniref:hypothetical protein n=1 Tax=Methylocapsa aurea TaxID=663610 RepID=UPI0012EB61BB|nr:hypothetical protein [Methylocapsa aurea]
MSSSWPMQATPKGPFAGIRLFTGRNSAAFVVGVVATDPRRPGKRAAAPAQ